MNPTLFLYRFAGPRGPGPFTMKYWWTLGCFPTGLEAPFRLHEFLATYKQAHVPVEVEEWLQYFVTNPAHSLATSLDALGESMSLVAVADDDTTSEDRGYRLHAPSIAGMLDPLHRVEKELMLAIPRAGIRAVMADTKLRRRAADELFEYTEAVKEGGSTPHRRAGYAQLTGNSLEQDLPQAIADGQALLGGVDPGALINNVRRQLGFTAASSALVATTAPVSATSVRPPPEAATTLVANAASIPAATASDEKALLRLMTTFAEGSMKIRRYDDAAMLLSNLLLFAHDDDVRAELHGNVATALNHDGQFKRAEFHGREAALLRASPRGYANWATAVAYQDDFERAEKILCDAVESVGHSHPVLQSAQNSIRAAASTGKRRDDVALNRRSHLPSQQWRGLNQGPGRMFDNEFDTVVFQNKLYVSKMNPTSNELGSVFRRVGDLGGHISSTKSMEPI